MVRKLHKDNKGFTIIEVLIVLAIAGLIMLIVFLAVPALQRNQRNNARNSDASRIATAVNECLANRNRSIATTGTGCGVPGNIDAGTLNQLTSFTVGTTDGTSTTAAVVRFGRQCDASGARDGGAGPSNSSFTVTYRLEPAVDRCIAG